MTLDIKARVVRGGLVIETDLQVENGTTLALLGPNGAGKSTLVATIAGTMPLDAGRITLNGRVLVDPARRVFVSPERRRVGVVHQDLLLFPHLTVIDNIGFAMRARGMTKRASREAASRWVEGLGLESLAAKLPDQLSGGEAQRVAIARALALGPEVLVLDEPTAALDVSARSEMRAFLATHLRTHEGPRVLITHDPTEAFVLADRIAIIESGKVTHLGSPDDIRRRPVTRYAADLAGINLVIGIADSGEVTTAEGHTFVVADSDVGGQVTLTIHPRAIVVHTTEPEGSARTVWRSPVVDVERIGDRTRLTIESPVGLTVEITRASAERLGVAPGVELWFSVKATEITVAQSS